MPEDAIREELAIADDVAAPPVVSAAPPVVSAAPAIPAALLPEPEAVSGSAARETAQVLPDPVAATGMPGDPVPASGGPGTPRVASGPLPGPRPAAAPVRSPAPAGMQPTAGSPSDHGSDDVVRVEAPTDGPSGPNAIAISEAGDIRPGCTAAQLRRFIKSRAYVPLHELRRRFELNGAEDDVSPVDVDGQRLYVGLPGREAQLLGELLRAGDVGCELLLDPVAPLVVGVFPMRPVPRA